jgi:hypothetical protein
VNIHYLEWFEDDTAIIGYLKKLSPQDDYSVYQPSLGLLQVKQEGEKISLLLGINVFIFIFLCIFAYIFVHVYMYLCIYLLIYICRYVYIYTYIYVYIYVYIYIHTYIIYSVIPNPRMTYTYICIYM